MQIGETYQTKQSGQIEILHVQDSRHVTIRFVNSGNVKVVTAHNIKRGSVSDKIAYSYRRNRYGVGFIGIGPYSHASHPLIYDKWSNMLQRCYSNKIHLREPSYQVCTVCDEWHNFQNFCEWCINNGFKKDLSLDKDILVKGNTVYSPDTCCFVPSAINKLFVKQQTQRGLLPIGVQHPKDEGYVAICMNPFTKKPERLGSFATPIEAFLCYKDFKESIIKAMAQKYKNHIDTHVYDAMMAYRVEITD